MSQTEVADAQTAAPFAGTVHRDLASYSKVNAEATAEMPFGILVCAGSEDNECVLPTDGARVVGVVMHSHAYAKPGELGDDGLKPEASVAVLAKGTIYVTVQEQVDAGDTVRVRLSGTGQKGGFLTSGTMDETAPLTGARYLTSAGSGEIALLEVDFTSESVLNDD